ncbi:thiopurine S-methyltransferase-like [Amblyomma americanum]
MACAEMKKTEDSLQGYWAQRWAQGDVPWHGNLRINRFLDRHQELILDGKKSATVFVPMCGKGRELHWFYAMGHVVYGVEYVEDVGRQFFVENDLAMSETVCPVLGCRVLKTRDGRLTIFICSIFDFSKECVPPIEIVWDRSGITAVREEDRGRYVSVMKSLLAPGFSYGLWTTSYDNPDYKDFPRSITDATVLKLYGNDFDVRKVEEIEKDIGFPTKVALWHIRSIQKK